MKFLFSFGFALAAAAAAQAQVFRPHLSGGHGHDRRRGPALHADVGHRYYYHGHFHRPFAHAVAVPYRGYGYSRYYGSPVYGYYDGYTGYDYPYNGGASYGTHGGGAAANGLLLGALAGGIIGHNRGEFRHNGWRGAAWGAGIGWLLGTVADANRRCVAYLPAPVARVAVPTFSSAPVPTAPATTAVQPVTIINNYYGGASPMGGVNALFGR